MLVLEKRYDGRFRVLWKCLGEVLMLFFRLNSTRSSTDDISIGSWCQHLRHGVSFTSARTDGDQTSIKLVFRLADCIRFNSHKLLTETSHNSLYINTAWFHDWSLPTLQCRTIDIIACAASTAAVMSARATSSWERLADLKNKFPNWRRR